MWRRLNKKLNYIMCNILISKNTNCTSKQLISAKLDLIIATWIYQTTKIYLILVNKTTNL